MKLPIKITFSNISLILGWWHWHLVFWVPFRTCLFSVLYLKFEIGCSLVRRTSWAESPRLSVWCACLVLHFSDLSVSCSLCFFFLSFFRISAVIWVLYFFLPHNCCSLIIPVLKRVSKNTRWFCWGLLNLGKLCSFTVTLPLKSYWYLNKLEPFPVIISSFLETFFHAYVYTALFPQSSQGDIIVNKA